ncbi:MAG: hypothetical protein KAS11_01115 [Candidatus Aenigmarchaeota archaeon]|nr:hypothetical protein [Candidatus Aenigmarchaeota archaeon]
MHEETYTIEQLAEDLQKHLTDNEHKTGFKIYSPYITSYKSEEYGYLFLIDGYIDTDHKKMKDNRCYLAIKQTGREVTVTFEYLKPTDDNDNFYEYEIFRDLFKDVSDKIKEDIHNYIITNNIAKQTL